LLVVLELQAQPELRALELLELREPPGLTELQELPE
jgi:hypothetical protein